MFDFISASCKSRHSVTVWSIGLIGFGNGHLFQKAQVSWSEAVVLRDESHGKIPVILFPVAVVLLEAIETIQ